MIEGDIDLTENLDFYRDRKSKEYRNSKDFHPPATSFGDKSKIWSFNGYQTNTTNISFGNHTYKFYDNITSTIDEFNIDDTNISSTSINTYYNDSDILYNYNDGTITITTNYNYTCTSNGRVSWTYNIPYEEKRPSTCDLLFGVKDTTDRVCTSIFGHRENKRYYNTSDFRHHKEEKDYDEALYTNNAVRIRRALFNRCWDTGYNAAEYLFGDKEKNMIPFGIPWLSDLKRNHRSMYDDYINELRGNEVSDDSRYLTDYGWLRIRN